jgi:hypothetical protein
MDIKLKNAWIYKNKKYNPGDIVKDVPKHVIEDLKSEKKTKVDFDILDDKGKVIVPKEEASKEEPKKDEVKK